MRELIDGYNKKYPNGKDVHDFRWRKQGRGQAITQPMLGHDHPKCLRLVEDGFDKLPVCSCTRKTAEGFFTYGLAHKFAPCRDVVRFAAFMGLDVYRTTALALKGLWEEFVSDGGYENGEGLDPKPKRERMNRLNGGAWNNLDHAKQCFQPDGDALFDEMFQCGDGRLLGGYDRTLFLALLNTMVTEEIYGCSVFASAVDDLAKQWQESLVSLQQKAEKYRFLWQNRLDELGDWLLWIESRRVQNAQINRDWKRLYDLADSSLQQAERRLGVLLTMLELKLRHPELNRDEVLAQVKAIAVAESQPSTKAASVLSDNDTFSKSNPAHQSAVALDPLEQSQQLLISIYRIINPHSTVYKGLNGSFRSVLERVLRELLAVDDNQLQGVIKTKLRQLMPDRADATAQAHDLVRSPKDLASIEENMQNMLMSKGWPRPQGPIIEGRSVSEVIALLEADIKLVEDMIEAAKVEAEQLDKQSGRYRQKLVQMQGDAMTHFDWLYKDRLDEAAEKHKEADELEDRLERLFTRDKA